MTEKMRGMDGRMSRLLPLFIATCTISATANSGYAILAVMKDDFVHKRGWLAEEEMADLVAIVQSSPAPMAVTASMTVGYQCAGFPGAIAAVLGCILPPLVVMSVVTLFYQTIVGFEPVYLFMRGMQLGVVGMLLDIIIGLFCSATRGGLAYTIALMALAFLYVSLTNWSIIFLAVGCALAGVVKAVLMSRGEGTR